MAALSEASATESDCLSNRLRRRITYAYRLPRSSRPRDRVTCRRFCQYRGLRPLRLFQILFLHCFQSYDGFDDVVIIPVMRIA